MQVRINLIEDVREGLTIQRGIPSVSCKVRLRFCFCPQLGAESIIVCREDGRILCVQAGGKLCYRCSFDLDIPPTPLIYDSVLSKNYDMVRSREVLSCQAVSYGKNRGIDSMAYQSSKREVL